MVEKCLFKDCSLLEKKALICLTMEFCFRRETNGVRRPGEDLGQDFQTVPCVSLDQGLRKGPSVLLTFSH